MEKSIDTIVLGCTHYPLIRGEVKESFSGASSVQVVDSAETTAEATRRILEENDMLKSEVNEKKLKVYLTDITSGFRTVAWRIMCGDDIEMETVSSEYSESGLRYGVDLYEK